MRLPTLLLFAFFLFFSSSSSCPVCECGPDLDVASPAEMGKDGCPVCECRISPPKTTKPADNGGISGAGGALFFGIGGATGGFGRASSSGRRRVRNTVRCERWKRVFGRFYCVKRVESYKYER